MKRSMMSVAMGMAAIAVLAVAAQAQESQRFIRFELAGDTLQPGDLIWTGTMGRTRALEPGDIYEVEVEGVGVLSNPVVQGR